MNVIINTDLCAFQFNLSQTSAIYLLSLAQKLEDEGEGKKEDHTGACKKKKEQEDTALKTIQGMPQWIEN